MTVLAALAIGAAMPVLAHGAVSANSSGDAHMTYVGSTLVRLRGEGRQGKLVVGGKVVATVTAPHRNGFATPALASDAHGYALLLRPYGTSQATLITGRPGAPARRRHVRIKPLLFGVATTNGYTAVGIQDEHRSELRIYAPDGSVRSIRLRQLDEPADLSAAGGRIAVGGVETIRLYDAATGRLTRLVPAEYMLTFALAADGRLAIGKSHENAVELLAPDGHVALLPLPGTPYRLRFGDDGTLAAEHEVSIDVSKVELFDRNNVRIGRSLPATTLGDFAVGAGQLTWWADDCELQQPITAAPDRITSGNCVRADVSVTATDKRVGRLRHQATIDVDCLHTDLDACTVRVTADPRRFRALAMTVRVPRGGHRRVVRDYRVTSPVDPRELFVHGRTRDRAGRTYATY